jgi:hypothetical protein
LVGKSSSTAEGLAAQIARARRNPWLVLALIGVLATPGCASFDPVPLDQLAFRDRALTQTENNISVTAVVLSEEESRQVFARDLYAQGVQPVWLEIENRDESIVWLLPISLDPDYFAPLEASYLHRFQFAKYANELMDRHFYELAIGEQVAPGQTRSGFVYTHMEHGSKVFNVDVIGQDHELRSFTFFVPVPGLRPDHQAVDWQGLYAPDEVVSHDRDGLRKALAALPCCVTAEADGAAGEPLNLVLIGEPRDLLYALVRSGWDETEKVATLEPRSTAIRGSVERYRPVSTRFAFGRSQDVSLRKSRDPGSPRSELRLWLAPLTLDGIPVWVGQIGRDFEVRPRSRQHAMDADEARGLLLQDLLYSQTLAALGFVKRGDFAAKPQLYQGLAGRPYYADGFRAVLQVSSEPTSLTEAENLRWDIPPWE